MSNHVVVGSGPIGSSIARLLAERGERVRMVTRSGGGPTHPLIERVAADAADARRLTELTQDAVTLSTAPTRSTRSGRSSGSP